MFHRDPPFRNVWGREAWLPYHDPTLSTRPAFQLFYNYRYLPDRKEDDSNNIDERYREFVARRELCITAIEYLADVRGQSQGHRPDPYTRARVVKVAQTEEWKYIYAFISHHYGQKDVLAGLAEELGELKRRVEYDIERLGMNNDLAAPPPPLRVPREGEDARLELLEETRWLVRRLSAREALKNRALQTPEVTDDEARLFALQEREDELEQALDLSFKGQ